MVLPTELWNKLFFLLVFSAIFSLISLASRSWRPLLDLSSLCESVLLTRFGWNLIIPSFAPSRGPLGWSPSTSRMRVSGFSFILTVTSFFGLLWPECNSVSTMVCDLGFSEYPYGHMEGCIFFILNNREACLWSTALALRVSFLGWWHVCVIAPGFVAKAGSERVPLSRFSFCTIFRSSLRVFFWRIVCFALCGLLAFTCPLQRCFCFVMCFSCLLLVRHMRSRRTPYCSFYVSYHWFCVSSAGSSPWAHSV